MTESSTTILRRLLDERGVEWTQGMAWNVTVINGDWLVIEDIDFGTLSVSTTTYRLTPEQAIAATLGSGECEMRRDEHGVWHCLSCEKGADKITGNDGELESWHDSWPPNFCPYCGAKVVDE